ncbi:hypothetical protein FCY96_16035 [Escherichia coli]|nr:hypothetical protein [Escherichia coli]
MSIKNDGHYFCRAGGNRPDGLNEPVTNEQKTHSHCKAAGTNPPCCVCQKYSQNKALPEAGRTYPVLYGH